MTNPTENPTRDSGRLPAAAWWLMLTILGAMILLALYSNIQRTRQSTIETVTIAPAPPTEASPGLTEASAEQTR